jgi:phosphate transport system protein
MSTDGHIRSKVDQLLLEIESDLITQTGYAEISFSQLENALGLGDFDVQEIEDLDFRNAQLSKEIFRKTVYFISKESPMADDLRFLISSLKVSESYERIGKLTKNIANRLDLMAKLSNKNISMHSLREMFREAHSLVNGSKAAYFSRDIVLAKDIIEKDFFIDSMYHSIFREYISYMLENPKNISNFVHLQFIAKQIERIGDHSTTIAEQAIFWRNGDDLSSWSRSKLDYLDE